MFEANKRTLRRFAPHSHPRLAGAAGVDVAVVGAGIVGLTTAYLLARAGLSVAVLEARRVGRHVTGRSTENRAGVRQIREWIDQLGIVCDFEQKDAYAYEAAQMLLTQPACMPRSTRTRGRRSEDSDRRRTWHTRQRLPCYVLDVGGPETLGQSTCRRGWPCLARREKPNGRSLAGDVDGAADSACRSEKAREPLGVSAQRLVSPHVGLTGLLNPT